MTSSERAIVRIETEALGIRGAAGPIEALLERAARGGGPSAVAITCHPHPLHGGTMRNKVVHTLSRSLVRLGAVGLRFNFRGVGASAGSYANGEGELDDALTVIDWATREWPRLPLYVAGFSFGAMVALRAAGARAAAGRPAAGLVTVAPAVDRFDFDFHHPSCPWLVVQGEDDDVVAADAVRRWCGRIEPAPSLELWSGTGHYFHGRLNDLARAVAEHFGPRLALAAAARTAAC